MTMKKTKFIKIFEWIIYIGLVVGSMAYLWNIFTLFEAKDTSIKVKEIEINKQPIIVICTNEDNGNFGRYIDEMENIQLNYSSYTIWGNDPDKNEKISDTTTNHKVIKFETAFSGTSTNYKDFSFYCC